jgi:histidinol-phosphate aminotransferase
VTATKEGIAAIARANGLDPLPSATNFVTIDCGGTDTLARAVVEELGREGVFICMPFAATGNRCVRISAGRRSGLDALAG